MIGSIQQAEVVEWLQCADLLIFPSKGEGMSMSVAEALACGVPTIAFNVVGVRGIVENNINGYLIEKRTSINLAKAINDGVVNIDKLSIGALVSSQKYDSGKVAKDIINVMESKFNEVNK